MVLPLVLAGLPGLLALLLVLPDLPGLPRAALLLNPALALVAMAFGGAVAAPRCGFRLRARDLPDGSLAVAAGMGLALGLTLAGGDHLLRGLWQAGPFRPPSVVEAWSPPALAVGLLYGGVVEEVLLRWGLMSLVVLGLWRGFARRAPRPPEWALGAGCAIAALAFAGSQIPGLLATGASLTPPLLLRVLILHMSAGLLYGWLFMRRDLVSAMVAHGATHLGYAGVAVIA